jgi:hypothetical protein
MRVLMMGRMGRRICRLTALRVNSIVSPIQRTTFPRRFGGVMLVLVARKFKVNGQTPQELRWFWLDTHMLC